MAKKYDIVETSQLSGEFDGSAIDVTKVSNEDVLENGRAVIEDETKGIVSYPTDDKKPVVLHASVEKMGDTSFGLTDFYKEKGEKVRIYRFEKGRKFGTTAIQTGGTDERTDYTSIQVGDSVGIGKDGKFKVYSDSSKNKSVFQGEVIKKITLGFDMTPAIRIKVTAC